MQGLKKNFVQNTGWMLADRIYQLLLSVVVGSLIARYLGPQLYGLLNYGLSIITVFAAVASLGIESVLVNEIIRQPNKTGLLVGTSFALRALSGLLSTGLSVLYVLVCEPSRQALLLITFLQGISLVFRFYEIFDLFFQSRLQSKYSVIVRSIAITCVGAWKIYLLYTRATVQMFALSVTIEALVCALALMFFYNRYGGPRLRVSAAAAKDLFSLSRHFMVASLLVVIYTRVDKILLGFFTDDATLGIYMAAVTISDMWMFVPVALINSARPIIFASRQQGLEAYENNMKMLYMVIIIMGGAMSIGVSLLSGVIIRILYGQAYLAAQGPLMLLVWSSIFAVLGVARNIWILSEGHQKYIKYFSLATAFVNAVLNVLLIGPLGMMGVAIAAFCAQVTMAIIAPLCVKATRPMAIHILTCLFCKESYKNLRKLLKN